jgi:hypothetical protein
MAMYALGQTVASKRAPWLEPYTPTRLEWLVLETQATYGKPWLGENGISIDYYIGPDSLRTGEILCDIAYRPGTQAEAVQAVEDGILKRFEITRQAYPWARVKIVKNAVKLN